MKVLLINGSPRKKGNTSIALSEMEKVFAEENIEFTRVDIGSEAIRGCIDCQRCFTLGKCVFEDSVNKTAALFEEADGLVVASPVYYGQANGSLVSFLQRLFRVSRFDKTMKVGCAVGVARRGGLTATYDELNKFFGISGMPIASGQYWNGVHGMNIGEANEDKEGLQQMRTLAKNMVFLMKSIELGKEKYGLPVKEAHISTNFVRKETK